MNMNIYMFRFVVLECVTSKSRTRLIYFWNGVGSAYMLVAVGSFRAVAGPHVVRRCSRPLLVCIGLEAWTEAAPRGRTRWTDARRAARCRRAVAGGSTCAPRLRHGALRRSSSSSGAVLGVLSTWVVGLISWA